LATKENEDFEKVLAVIHSCKTFPQINNAWNMVYNFTKLYPRGKMHRILLDEYKKKNSELCKLFLFDQL
jgi:hypothetical protein